MQKAFHVLHVEDNDFAASTTATVLQSLNPTWQIERAHNLELAEDLLRANPKKFGLVLLDLRLPRIAGLEGLKRILAIVPHMCVVIYTGTIDEDIEDAAFEHGAQSYIYKPCDNDELYRKIKRAVVRFYGTLERCTPKVAEVKALEPTPPIESPLLKKWQFWAATFAAIATAATTVGAFGKSVGHFIVEVWQKLFK